MATNIFEKVLENVDIGDVVSKYVQLEPKGKNLFGLCPFHNDNNPSMSVSREKGIFNCFVCKKGGDAIKFIELYKNLDRLEATKFLAQEYRIDISEYLHQKVDKNKKYFDMADLSNKYFQYVMGDMNFSEEARKYLLNRGITDEVIKEFDIGLSLNKSNALTEVLLNKGFIESDIIDNGLSTGKNDTFIDRIIVPIRNESSKVVAFGGRIYKDGQNQNKYLNSKETPIFKKGELVFNLDKASKSLSDYNFLIINEGYMDVITSYSKGIKNAVALMGTAMTSEQAKLIAKYTKNVCLILDGDRAGVTAVASVYKRLEEENVNVSIVILPDNSDPDEFLRKNGTEAYVKYIKEHKLDKMAYFYELARLDYPVLNSFNMESFKRNIFDMIKNETSRSVIETFLKRLSLDLKVSFESLDQDFTSYVKGSGKKITQKAEIKVNDSFEVTPIQDKTEKLIIDYSINDYRFFARIEDSMESRVFLKIPKYKTLFIEIGDIYDSNKIISSSELINALKGRNVYNDYEYNPKVDFSMVDLTDNVLKTFKKEDIKEQIKALKLALLSSDLKSDFSKEIQAKIMALNKELRK